MRVTTLGPINSIKSSKIENYELPYTEFNKNNDYFRARSSFLRKLGFEQLLNYYRNEFTTIELSTLKDMTETEFLQFCRRFKANFDNFESIYKEYSERKELIDSKEI